MKKQTPFIISVNFMLFMIINPVWAVTKHVPSEYGTIQAAIDDCNDGDTVLVASGTYTGEGNRDIDFNGKAVTLKSESGAETCIIDCQASEQDLHRGFYFHNREGNDSVLDGFTIMNGCAWHGGGIRCRSSSPTIKNCIIRNNRAAPGKPGDFVGNGGGICAVSSNLEVTDCVIKENQAFLGGGIALVSYRLEGTYPKPAVSTCTIQGNHADIGGGIYGVGYVAVVNCLISNNSADIGGGVSTSGGIFVFGNTTITNSTICGNVALSIGGGIDCGEWASPSVMNSILWGNKAVEGSQISMFCIDRGSSLLIRDSLVEGGKASISYEGPKSWCRLTWGPGNLDTDPLFSGPDKNDYHLRSQAGRWDPNSQTWVQDDVTSPCIDAGDPNSPIMHEPFPNGGYVNMGAYGGTSEASKSYFGGPVCETIIAGDINGDCRVDSEDLRILMSHWTEGEY